MVEQIVATVGIGGIAAGVRVLVHWLSLRERERVFSRALSSRGDVAVEYRGAHRARMTVRSHRRGERG
ncbi:hypothetical protein GCM10010420_04360 [Streptomyces glaucosporus]|uniref:Secreted protein n=1 Tax=Streptomyces glaucosporus TaxID=284044 RepID=A0ABP5UPF7_9ACTN